MIWKGEGGHYPLSVSWLTHCVCECVFVFVCVRVTLLIINARALTIFPHSSPCLPALPHPHPPKQNAHSHPRVSPFPTQLIPHLILYNIFVLSSVTWLCVRSGMGGGFHCSLISPVLLVSFLVINYPHTTTISLFSCV